MKLLARAKVNFTLDVFPRRADGYHDLHSLVVPISLADEVEVAPAARTSLAVTADGVDCAALGGDAEQNLAVRALRALQRATGRRDEAALSIVKRIPLGGGLGGGSADAAAVLRALNRLWGLGLSAAELAAVGAAVGSDVPALVWNGAVVMEGRGERVTPLELAVDFPLVAVFPSVASSTAEIYRLADAYLTNHPVTLDNMRPAIQAGDAAGTAAFLRNDLEAAACARHPEIARARRALLEAGVAGALMSGSGSTVFGLVPSEEAGRAIASSLRARGFAARCVRTECPVV